MSPGSFKVLVVFEKKDGGFVRKIEDRSLVDLPEGDVLVRVHYSSLNYKDALSASGHKGVTRSYPHTPGIDAAGLVEVSESDVFRPGDEVIVTSYDLGMNTPGGWGQYIRVPADWVVPLPNGLALRESMIFGTAGFTAALSVHKLQTHGVTPDQGEILVTGATGGVGSLAVGILARDGYQVVAATGKRDAEPFLRELGAAEVVPRDKVLDASPRPLLKGRWAGAVDTVGGEYLATALKSTRYGGAVTCCGLVASADLSTTVYPFILRGVSLLGIDSQNCPMDIRLLMWQKLAQEWKLEHLDRLASECSLDELDGEIERMLQGKQRGRVVVSVGV
ncbi:MAG: YhdH/YhfP family quinone oxidoreductase [Anaerolineae bacterium]|jgi:putative YhdH/YhfP family quinone oxidoreductase